MANPAAVWVQSVRTTSSLLVNAMATDRRYNSPMATLRVHIVPNAKIDKVIGEHGGAIKIKLRAPAVEGKANAALRCFLADQ
ncbi:MAG: DUF167 domain-containing protein, partial [Limisphaerales bacterium]